MLPFTNQKLEIEGNHFIYDRSSKVHSIARFSYNVFNDLKNYLGIERELNEHMKMASYLNSEVGKPGQVSIYDIMKIERINSFYNHYLDFVLETTMILYYTVYDKLVLHAIADSQFLTVYHTIIKTHAKVASKNSIIRNYDPKKLTLEDVIFTHIINSEIKAVDKERLQQTSDLIKSYFRKSGLQLSTCFEKAKAKCEPMYAMVKQMIEEEYPTHTFADNNTKTAKQFSIKTKK